ncbi:MAG: site-specific integrase [Deltaproteobacteria bacterium]|jgi:integrase|nr:site-specific integrase [Deltaproteobacteria bacterium]
MATHKRVTTRFTGVFTRTTSDPKRKHNGRPDRVFDIYWRDADGKQCWEVTGWLSEGMTEQAAFNLRTERLAAVKKSVSFSPIQGSLPTGAQQTQPLPEDPQKPALDTPLFSTIAENYLRWLEGESKYADREKFRYDTHLLKPLGNVPVDQIAITNANNFKHQLMPKMAIGTVKKCLSLCRAMYFYASLTGAYSGLNPFSRRCGFNMPKGATECERFLTPDEAKILLAELAKRSPQLRNMCYVSLHTGIRPCELYSIRGGDLVPQAGFFWVDGKGGKREKVAASKEILEILGNYKRKPHEYIFQSKSGGKIKQTSDTLRRTVEDLGLSPRTVIKKGGKEVRVKMAPEEKKEYQRKKIWLHTFRHTFASWLAQSGTVTLLELRDLLRHESTQMTERYAHMIPDKLVEQSSKINKILGEVA